MSMYSPVHGEEVGCGFWCVVLLIVCIILFSIIHDCSESLGIYEPPGKKMTLKDAGVIIYGCENKDGWITNSNNFPVRIKIVHLYRGGETTETIFELESGETNGFFSTKRYAVYIVNYKGTEIGHIELCKKKIEISLCCPSHEVKAVTTHKGEKMKIGKFSENDSYIISPRYHIEAAFLQEILLNLIKYKKARYVGSGTEIENSQQIRNLTFEIVNKIKFKFIPTDDLELWQAFKRELEGTPNLYYMAYWYQKETNSLGNWYESKVVTKAENLKKIKLIVTTFSCERCDKPISDHYAYTRICQECVDKVLENKK